MKYFDIFKDISNIKEFVKKQIFNTFSFDERINKLKKINLKKYSSTDELYLNIIINNG